jgi:hypothetical protein
METDLPAIRPKNDTKHVNLSKTQQDVLINQIQ